MEQQTTQPTFEPRPADKPLPVLDSGELTFRLRNGECEIDCRMDLLQTKLTCEECEAMHSLQVVDGRLQPTAAFLGELAARLQSIGAEGCTPSQAWKIWIATAEAMDSLKNAFSEMPS